MQRQKYQILYTLQYNVAFFNFCQLTTKPLNLRSTACTCHQSMKMIWAIVTTTSYKDLIMKLVSSSTQNRVCLTDAYLVQVQKRLFRIFYFILKQASTTPQIQSNCCLLHALTELRFTFFCDVRPCSMLDMYQHLEEPATSFLHNITPLKAVIFAVTFVRTSNLTELNHRLENRFCMKKTLNSLNPPNYN
jgi:hypothetical protein